MCNKGMKFPVLLWCIFSLLAASVFARDKGNRINSVADLDLAGFAGTWYEIARLPNRHERQLVDVTSTFTIRDDGGIAVVNQGYKGSRKGKRMVLKGDVSIPDRNNMGAMKIKVFRIFSLDYKIIDIDRENYSYAMVSTNSRDYLWVFSKTPVMSEDVYAKLIDSARGKGFDVDRLERVSQDGNSALAEKTE